VADVCVAVCCSVLQCDAVCCSVLQCVAVCFNMLQCVEWVVCVSECVAVCCTHCNNALQQPATYRHAAARARIQFLPVDCNTLQHAASHRTTLQLTATHRNTLQHTATYCNTLQCAGMPQHMRELISYMLTATHCNTLQHTATHCNTLQHTATRYKHAIMCRHARAHARTQFVCALD